MICWLERSASALFRIVPNRPDPARPDPARPAISATRVRALKMSDLGPAVFASFAPILGLARLGPARPSLAQLAWPAWPPGPARPGLAWPSPARPGLARPGSARPGPARLGSVWWFSLCFARPGSARFGGFRCALLGFAGGGLSFARFRLVLFGSAWFSWKSSGSAMEMRWKCNGSAVEDIANAVEVKAVEFVLVCSVSSQ